MPGTLAGTAPSPRWWKHPRPQGRQGRPGPAAGQGQGRPGPGAAAGEENRVVHSRAQGPGPLLPAVRFGATPGPAPPVPTGRRGATQTAPRSEALREPGEGLPIRKGGKGGERLFLAESQSRRSGSLSEVCQVRGPTLGSSKPFLLRALPFLRAAGCGRQWPPRARAESGRLRTQG